MSRSKKIMALFLSIVMVLGLLPASAFAANDTSAFSDVKTSAWYHEDVQYVSENGLMKGTGENLFSPDATTTRGMIVTILYRLEGEPSPTGACPFQDVASGKYYEKAITWAAENGIVSGFSADTFGPDQNITREQMAAILYRYATYKKYDVSTAGDLSKFPDADKVSSYAVDAMKWANAAGLINGSNDGKLYPAGNATRAQVAAILTRFCKNIAAQCTVTFQLNYGSEGTYTTLKVAKGDTITAPKAPTRSGYTFSSWSEKTSGSAFDFKTPIEKDITLYAQWNKKSSGSSGSGSTSKPSVEEKSDAEKYYENNSKLVSIIDIKKSETIPVEKEVISSLAERGFADYPITYDYSIDGEYISENVASEDSTTKHPMYETFYQSENGDGWMIYIINGSIFANPASFNLESDLEAQLLISESNLLTSYDNATNKFYVTIPNESEAIVKIVDKIDAKTLDTLTVEEICKLSGATPPTSTDTEEPLSDELNSTQPLDGFEAISVTSSYATAPINDPLIIVSLGDSYSSGEGIEPFYGQEKSLTEKVKDQDWLAHRSKRSWPSMLSVPYATGAMSDYRVENGKTSTASVQWYFAAASGAETKHFNKEQQKKSYRKSLQLIGEELLPKQLDVFDNIHGDVDYVTLTIGGNDVGFSKIITTCAVNCSYLHFGATSKLEDIFSRLWSKFDETKSQIKGVYQNIQDKAGKQAAIIVAGYPKLLDKNRKSVAINKQEARLVNENVSKFNNQIESIINQCRAEGMNIHFVDVETEFDKDGGHQAYSPEAWINPIYLGAKSQDIDNFSIASAYSIHPNELGARAYARLVSDKIASIEHIYVQMIGSPKPSIYVSNSLKRILGVDNWNTPNDGMDNKICVGVDEKTRIVRFGGYRDFWDKPGLQGLRELNFTVNENQTVYNGYIIEHYVTEVCQRLNIRKEHIELWDQIIIKDGDGDYYCQAYIPTEEEFQAKYG